VVVMMWVRQLGTADALCAFGPSDGLIMTESTRAVSCFLIRAVQSCGK